MKIQNIYKICVYLMHTHKVKFAIAFIIAGIFGATGIKPLQLLASIFFCAFILLVFLGALSYLWDRKVRTKSSLTQKQMENYLFNHANAGVERRETFIQYTLKKHGGWIFLMSAIVITGTIIAIIDTRNGYYGGSWAFVAISVFFPTVSFIIDYLKTK